MIQNLLFLTALIVFNSPVHLKADEGDFAKHKAEMLSHIDGRLQKLQEHKNCVAAANDREALKKCRMTMKEWRKGEMMEHMEHKKDKLEGKMKKMKEKGNLDLDDKE